VAITDANGHVTTYEYDVLNRLHRESDPLGNTTQYAYDAVGNRLAMATSNGSTSYEYDAANRLTSVDGVPYTWDNNGNLLSDGTRTFQYDYANRLVQERHLDNRVRIQRRRPPRVQNGERHRDPLHAGHRHGPTAAIY